MKCHIAIEAGATGSRAGLYDASFTLLRDCEGAAANPLEVGVAQAAQILVGLIHTLCAPEEIELGRIVAGVAGAGKGDGAERLAEEIIQGCTAESVSVCNDIIPLLEANLGTEQGILVIAGTGSSVIAQSASGVTQGVGGHGSLMGDRGSAYRLGVEALSACSAMEDGTGPETELCDATMEHTQAHNFDALILWSHEAGKTEIAALAPIVMACVDSGDAIARDILNTQAAHLADQVMAARQKASLDAQVPVWMYGGVLENAPGYVEAFSVALKACWPECEAKMAVRQGLEAVASLFTSSRVDLVTRTRKDRVQVLAATERMLPSEVPLDTMTALAITDWMTQADGALHGVLQRARESLAEAIDSGAQSIATGGRIIYLGAGTSGRLGVLDASECPPTFGVSSDQVVGLIAGGDGALRNSIEGAEDSPEQAQEDLAVLSSPLNKHDFVVGITASGTASYVHGALAYAQSMGAKTALMSCNPVRCEAADLFIVLETGPEVLPGSTRLKAGSATKLALNQITTGAMARCGHIYEGYMVGVKGVNVKLRARTIRIVSDLLTLEAAEAEAQLEAADGDIKVAVLMHRCGVSRDEAQNRLVKTGGHLREALAL